MPTSLRENSQRDASQYNSFSAPAIHLLKTLHRSKASITGSALLNAVLDALKGCSLRQGRAGLCLIVSAFLE